MRVSEVTYERLSKERVGSYENERAACTVTVDEGESPDLAFQLAKFHVENELGLLPTDEDIDNAVAVLSKAGIKVVGVQWKE